MNSLSGSVLCDVVVVGVELKPLNGDQKAAEAAQGEAAGETAADSTVIVLDGKQKR